MVKSIRFKGNNIIVIDCYVVKRVNDKFVLFISTDDATPDIIKELEDTDSIDYYEDDVLKNSYTNYKDMNCIYTNKIYQIELTRVDRMEETINSIKEDLRIASDALEQLIYMFMEVMQ